MTAAVTAYSANPWDTDLTLKIECTTCWIEWGWSRDSQKNYERLQEWAATHDAENHGDNGATDDDYERFKEARDGR